MIQHFQGGMFLMNSRSSHSLQFVCRWTLRAMALILILGTVACSSAPRKHWWQFWRPKATLTSTVYNPSNVLPPPPESPDRGMGIGFRIEQRGLG
jgi:hypothetical protein